MGASVLALAVVGLKVASTFLLIPILRNHLGSVEFSLWILIQSVAIYVSLCEGGLGQTVVNFVGAAFARGDRARIRQIQATAYTLYWSVISTTCVLALGTIWFTPADRWLLGDVTPETAALFRNGLAVTVGLTLLRVPLLVFPGCLTGLRRMPLRNACDLAGTVVTFLATLVAAFAGAGLLGICATSCIAQMASPIAAMLIVRRRFPWTRFRVVDVRPGQFSMLAKNSFFFFLISLTFVVDRSAGNLLVCRFDSLEHVPGIFLLLTIFRVAGHALITVPSRSAQPYVMMWTIQGRIEQVAGISVLTIKLTFWVALAFACLVTCHADAFFSIWLGPGLFPGLPVLLCLAATFLLDAALAAPTNFMMGINRHRQLSLVLILKSVLSIALAALGAWCFPSNPTLGVASGFLVATIITAPPLLLAAAICLAFDGRTAFLFGSVRLVPLALVSLGLCSFASTTAGHLQFVISPVLMGLILAGCWRLIFDAVERSRIVATSKRLLPAWAPLSVTANHQEATAA
jgi:O-antigen/teichoic acid export membrane protein